MNTITLGRKPTLGEVCDYYCREDFLDFMLAVLCVYRVVLVAPRTLHWEPDWGEDEVRAETPVELKRFILNKISTYLRGVDWDERPPYYPSFHQSVWKRPVGGEGRLRDCVFEADLPTWRDAFHDVGSLLSLLDDHGVRYRHKFSGHRSLHIVIPAEIIPHGYRGKATQKLALRLLRWSGSQAHPLPEITRLPYSLNEDTGLICLPIARGALSGFRPWQANLHLVEIEAAAWHDPYTEDDLTAMTTFLAALTTATPSRTFPAPDTSCIVATYQSRLAQVHGDGAVGEAWAFLGSARRLPEAALLAGLSLEDTDARWLALEAYLLHGTGLSPAGISGLLAEKEEYARVAAMDVLLRFEDDFFPTLVQRLGTLQTYTPAGAQVAYLLTQSDSLRRRALDTLLAANGNVYDALIASACLAGAMGSDWTGAFRIVQPMREAADLTDRQRAQLAALDLISAMGTWDRREGFKQAQALCALGPGVTDLVLLVAGSPNRNLRRDLVAALVELADPRSVPLLVAALSDDYSKVRRKAISALTRIGAPAVDPLIAALGSDQAKVRRHAALCLGYMSKNPALTARIKPALLQMLDDSDADVVRQAIRALKDVVAEADMDRIVQFLRETTSWENAQQATEVLAALGEVGRAMLENLTLREFIPAAAYAIAAQGDTRGGDILAAALATEDALKRQAAWELLAELRDPRCVPYLVEQLQTLVHWRTMEYAHQLGEIGTPEAVDGLIAALGREDKFTHRGAVRGLGLARDPRAIPHLIPCLCDDDGKSRGLAVDALVQVGPAAIAPLRQALESESPPGRQLQNRIHQILRKLGESV